MYYSVLDPEFQSTVTLAILQQLWSSCCCPVLSRLSVSLSSPGSALGPPLCSGRLRARTPQPFPPSARHHSPPGSRPSAPAGGRERLCARGRGAAGVSREPRAGPARSRRRLPPPCPRHVFSLTSRCRRKDAALRGGSSHAPAPRRTRTEVCRLLAAAR